MWASDERSLLVSEPCSLSCIPTARLCKMYSHFSISEILRCYRGNECQASSNALQTQQRSCNFAHNVLHLPQPVEPKLTNSLGATFPASSDALLRHDAFRSSSIFPIEHQHQVRSLPGLCNILTPITHKSSSVPHGVLWRSDEVVSVNQRGHDGQHDQRQTSMGGYMPLPWRSHIETGQLQHIYQPNCAKLPVPMTHY